MIDGTRARSASVETKLRTLVAWYEWSAQPGHDKVAETLQDAADALAEKALSVEAAKALIEVWRPMVGHEARVGRLPRSGRKAVPEVDVLRFAVDDIRGMIERAKPADRPRLVECLRMQLAILEQAEGGSRGR